MMRTKIYKHTNLSPAKLNSDTNEDLNKKKKCIQKVLKTKSIEIKNQIHHQEILP